MCGVLCTTAHLDETKRDAFLMLLVGCSGATLEGDVGWRACVNSRIENGAVVAVSFRGCRYTMYVCVYGQRGCMVATKPLHPNAGNTLPRHGLILRVSPAAVRIGGRQDIG